MTVIASSSATLLVLVSVARRRARLKDEQRPPIDVTPDRDTGEHEPEWGTEHSTVAEIADRISREQQEAERPLAVVRGVFRGSLDD